MDESVSKKLHIASGFNDFREFYVEKRSLLCYNIVSDNLSPASTEKIMEVIALQRNSRNPYSSQQSRSRNPYASAQRPSVQRSAPRSAQQSSSRSAQQPGRSHGPYSRSSTRSTGGSSGVFQLNTNGRILLLAIALIIVVAIVFGVVRLVGGNKQDTANVPQLSSQNTQAPVADPTDEPAADANAESKSTGEPAAAETPVPQSATAQPQASSSNGLRSATIRSIGDFVIHEPIYKSAKLEDGSYDFTGMLTYIKESMADADYTVANVDGPMGGAGKRGYKGYPQFNTPPHLMKNLKDIGVDMLTLANNHALDTYFDGLKAEIEACISIGMDYVGAARTREEDDTPVIKEINGIKVGFLNYTQSTNTMEKHSDEAASQYGLDICKYADFEADAQAARDAGAEVLVAYMHWGEEYKRNPGSDQRSYGSKLVAAGVDVIIGGHPHVVQPAYWLEGTRTSDGGTQRTLCLASLGNFLSDQRLQYRDGGIIFEFTIQEIAAGQFEITNPQYIPTYVWRTGDEDSGYEYSVVPCGPYLEDAPTGMDSADHARLVEIWHETIEHMNTGNANAVVTEK